VYNPKILLRKKNVRGKYEKKKKPDVYSVNALLKAKKKLTFFLAQTLL
jgi:hypothetical protein